MAASQSNTIVSYSVFSGLVKCGVYIGNGSTQNIYIGYQPDYILIHSSDNHLYTFFYSRLGSAGNTIRQWGPTENSITWAWTTPSIAANATGFSVGDGANTNGAKYYYVAFKSGGT